MNVASWPHFGKPWLDVKHGRSVYCVKVFNMKVETVNLDQSAAGNSEPIDTPHVPVPKDSDCGPLRIISCAARSEIEIRRVSEMEPKYDLQVREPIQSRAQR